MVQIIWRSFLTGSFVIAIVIVDKSSIVQIITVALRIKCRKCANYLHVRGAGFLREICGLFSTKTGFEN